MSSSLTVIVPVLHDSAAAGRILAQIAPDPRVEVVIVDGGFDEELERLAGSRAGTRLLRSTAGRARQMMRIIDNAAWRVGASMASG